jgi:ECF transporter S component (folate family)
MNRELTFGRKAKACGTKFASRCYIKIAFYVVLGNCKEGGNFMKQLFVICSDSILELKKTKNMVFCALMAALAVILGYMTTIEIGPYIKVGFFGIPNRVVDYMFGPMIGGIFGGTLDILKYFARPTGPFFAGFTVSEILSGLIYGAILYKKPVTIKRIAIAGFIDKAIVNCGLNTLWLTMLYGKGFFILLPARILKNLIMWPIDGIILFMLLTYVVQAIKSFYNKE